MIWFISLLAMAGGVERIADAPGSVMPTRHWDVKHLDLSVRIDPASSKVSGTTRHTIVPLGAPWGVVRLHQVGLTIDAVQVDGAEATFRTGADWLEITVTPGQPHEVAVRYRASPQTGLHFQSPAAGDHIVEAWSQGEGEDNRHWFPSWDHPNDRFTLATHVTAPDKLTAIANGALVKKDRAESGWTTWSYAMEQQLVNYLVVVAVGDYIVHTDDDGPTPQEIWTRRGVKGGVARRGFGDAGPQLEWFGELLNAPYPYPLYRQVVVQRFLYGGMENTTTTVMSDGLLVDEGWKTDLHAQSVTAHEGAHQWFGDLLTCYGWRELWLNEGFATYYARRWMAHKHGEQYAAASRRRHFNGGLGLARPMAARSWSRTDDQPNGGVYVRGAAVLTMLEEYLGRDVFDEGIRLYVRRNRDRLVETQDLRRALEDVSGQHLGWLFDQWVYRGGAPKLTATHHWRPASDDNPAQLEVTIDQTTEGKAWSAPVEVEIGTTDAVLRRRIWVAAGTSRLVLDLPEAPRWVVADPQMAVIAHWKRTQDPNEWTAALEHSESQHVRLTALRALREVKASDQVVAALEQVLVDEEHHHAFRREAAQSLAKLGTDEADAALRQGLSARPHEVRSAVTAALGSMPTMDSRTQRLRTLQRQDPHARVRAEALRTLSELKATGIEPLAIRTLKSGERPEQEAALRALGASGDKKQLRRIVSYMSIRTHHNLRMAAAHAAAKLVTQHRDDKALAARLSRALEAMLDDPDLRVRRTAVHVLGRVGDEAAAKRLVAYAHQTTLEKQAGSARDAANNIRNRSKEAQEPPSPDDLQRLQEKLEELQRRFKDLESRP